MYRGNGGSSSASGSEANSPAECGGCTGIKTCESGWDRRWENLGRRATRRGSGERGGLRNHDPRVCEGYPARCNKDSPCFRSRTATMRVPGVHRDPDASKRSKTVPSDASSEPLSKPSSGGHGRPRRQVFRAVRRGCLQGAAPQSCGALNPQLGMLLVIMLLSATLVLRIPKISSSKFGTRTCSLRRCCIRACTRACLRVLG